MKTQKELFIEMLVTTNVPHSISMNYVTVENFPDWTGYSGFCSCWEFDLDGKLISVGHFER